MPRKGIPIGNLTSQIFANIYLNELDRFVKYYLKPKFYLRYGDDFVVLDNSLNQLKDFRLKIIDFLNNKLKLEINSKTDIVVKARWGLHFLGVEIFPRGRRLNKRNWRRIFERCNLSNVSSYAGLVRKHSNKKKIKYFNWFTTGL